jgi:CheY-like chemotaxis protein
MDDEESIRRLLMQVLGRLGYDVVTAKDGDEAIGLYEAAAAEGRAFDAVLLDLTVGGGLGGVETASRIKGLNPSAKLIASSGYSDAPVMSRYRDYGFTEAISKPWAVAQLSQVFRRVLVGDPPDQG